MAICDDDQIFARQNEAMVREIMAENQIREGIDYKIDLYTSPDQLCEKVLGKKDYYQMLLLDISLDSSNGVEVARELRESEAACRLIYITAYRDYVFECFDTRPLQYLLKPVERDKLSEALLYDYQNNYRSEQQLLQIGKKILPVRVREILYAESIQHKVVIRLHNGEKVFWNNSLSALQKELPREFFCRCHNSYLVNLSCVMQIVRYRVTLKGGICIPVSKQNYSKVMDQYIEYLKI